MYTQLQPVLVETCDTIVMDFTRSVSAIVAKVDISADDLIIPIAAT